MSIVKIASFGYKIFVVLSSKQSVLYNVGSLRQVRVKNVFFVVQYLTKKRLICIVEQISNSCRLFVVITELLRQVTMMLLAVRNWGPAQPEYVERSHKSVS